MESQFLLLEGSKQTIFIEPVGTLDSLLICVFTAASVSSTCAKHLVVMFLNMPLKPLQTLKSTWPLRIDLLTGLLLLLQCRAE